VRTQLRKKDGFSLIELLISIVIIGILASMSVTIWNKRKEEAFLAGMKSDLRNLAVAEEAYFTDHAAYTSDTDDLVFRSSPNVVFTLQADQDGWAGNASHPAVSVECALFVGNIAPLSPARREGIVWCE
jgi:type IV pilus assembly protein PilE